MTRSVTLTNHGARPWTTNKVAQCHRMAWAAHTKDTRETFAMMALSVRVDGGEPFCCVHIDATPLHRDKRSPQDVGACAPEVKAAIDGLVDAGMLPDDDPRYVKSITFYPPDVCGMDGLRLVIREATS